MMQHWAVTVEGDGEKIVTIESNCLSGKADLTAEDEKVIQMAADHLISFINVSPTPRYEDVFCLATIVQWWDGLPPRLRQDIEGSGAEPGGIAKARRLVEFYANRGDFRFGK